MFNHTSFFYIISLKEKMKAFFFWLFDITYICDKIKVTLKEQRILRHAH